MNIDNMWSYFWYRVPQYMNSHMYDVMVYLCGTFALVLTLILKKYIKRYNRKLVIKRFGEECTEASDKFYRRRNLWVALIAACLSLGLFGIVAYGSYILRLNTIWTLISPFVPIAEYTVWEMLKKGNTGRLIFAAIVLVAIEVNYLYCMANETHHKACYVIRYLMLVFGIIGVLDQFFRFRPERRGKKEKDS